MSIQPQLITSPGTIEGLVHNVGDLTRRLQHVQGAQTVIRGVAAAGPGTITASHIQAGAITAGAIAAGAIAAEHIAAGAIQAGHIAANSIQTTHLAANSVTAAKIAAEQITAFHIAAGTITATQISAGAIDTQHLVAGGVSADKLAANSVTAVKIAADSVATTHLQADSVTAGKIGASQITSAHIQTGTIVAGNIAATTITAAQMAANSITATQLAANAVTAAKITAGVIDATHIAVDAITTDKIAAGAVTAVKITTSSLSAISTNMGSITAGTITGATFQTAMSGARTMMDGVGLRGYAVDGVTKIFEIAGGVASFSGTATLGSGSVVPGSTLTGTIPASTVPALGGGNRLFNGSAETTDISHIGLYLNGATGVTLASSTAQSYHGARSVLLTAPNGGSPYFQWGLSVAQMAKVNPGENYMASIYARMGTAVSRSMHMYLRWHTAAGAFVSDAPVVAYNVNDTWTRLSTGGPAPATAAWASVLVVTQNLIAGDTAYFDGAQIEAGSVLTAFAPKPDENLPASITNAMIADLAATKVTGQLTSTQIADLDAAKLSGTLAIARIADGTLTDAKLAAIAASKVTGQLTNAQIAALDAAKLTGTLAIARIADGTLTDAKLAAIAASKITGQLTDSQISAIAAAKMTGQITSTQITDGAISTPKLAAGSVTAATIAADTITASQIAANAITATELAAGAVTTAKLVAGAITSNELAANSVIAGKIAALSITANEIAATTITGAKLVANTITAGQIAALTITAAEIAAGTITGAKLVAGTITSNEIAAVTIVAGDIASGTITGVQIAAGTISATHLVANTITAGQIAVGTITATELAAGSVTAAKLAAGAVTTESLTVAALANSSTPNGGFEDVHPTNATMPAKWVVLGLFGGAAYTSRAASAARSGGFGLRLAPIAGAAAEAESSAYIPVNAGDVWHYSVWARKTGTGAASFSAGLEYRTDPATYTGTITWDLASALDLSTAWTKYEGQVTIPVGQKFVAPLLLNNTQNTGGVVEVDDVEFRKVTVSAQIADGAITTPKMTAGTINADRLLAASVTATQIAANAITATHIIAGAIKTHMLTVEFGGSNMLANTQAARSDNSIAPWGLISATATTSTDQAWEGTKSFKIIPTDASAAYFQQTVPGRGGAWYTASAYSFKPTGSSGQPYIYINCVDSVGGLLSSTATAGPLTANAWVRTVHSVQAPAGTTQINVYAAFVGPAINQPVYFDALQLEPGEIASAFARAPGEILPGEVGATQITPNSITTNEILAGTILGSDIAATTITGAHIQGTTITADKLSVTTLSAITANMGTITAGTITGATIRTAASGVRLEMSGTGTAASLKKYDSGGAIAVSIGVQDGMMMLSNTSWATGWVTNDRKIQWKSPSSGALTGEIALYEGAYIGGDSLTSRQLSLDARLDGTVNVARSAIGVRLDSDTSAYSAVAIESTATTSAATVRARLYSRMLLNSLGESDFFDKINMPQRMYKIGVLDSSYLMLTSAGAGSINVSPGHYVYRPGFYGKELAYFNFTGVTNYPVPGYALGPRTYYLYSYANAGAAGLHLAVDSPSQSSSMELIWEFVMNSSGTITAMTDHRRWAKGALGQRRAGATPLALTANVWTDIGVGFWLNIDAHQDTSYNLPVTALRASWSIPVLASASGGTFMTRLFEKIGTNSPTMVPLSEVHRSVYPNWTDDMTHSHVYTPDPLYGVRRMFSVQVMAPNAGWSVANAAQKQATLVVEELGQSLGHNGT